MPLNAARFPRVLYLVFILGLVFLSFGVRQTLRTWAFVAGPAHARGTVTELVPRSTGRHSGLVYYPRFTFQAADGRTVSLVSREGSNPAGFWPGDHIGVSYDPNNPANALIDSFGQTWGGDLLLWFLGLFFTVIPGFLWGRARAASRAVRAAGLQP
jgi:hypothetical protein